MPRLGAIFSGFSTGLACRSRFAVLSVGDHLFGGGRVLGGRQERKKEKKKQNTVYILIYKQLPAAVVTVRIPDGGGGGVKKAAGGPEKKSGQGARGSEHGRDTDGEGDGETGSPPPPPRRCSGRLCRRWVGVVLCACAAYDEGFRAPRPTVTTIFTRPPCGGGRQQGCPKARRAPGGGDREKTVTADSTPTWILRVMRARIKRSVAGETSNKTGENRGR